MSKLPSISASRTVRALQSLEYVIDRQRGSHIILRQSERPHRRLVVPNHPTIAKGTLRALIREAGLTVQEFCDAL